MADEEKPKRKPIVEMTSAELYALDFAKMEPAERAAFRDELIEKPGHGPLASQREHRIYAEAHARWSDWIKDHPEDDVAEGHKPVSDSMGAGAPLIPPPPPTPPQPRPDGTSPRRPPPGGSGL
jgi:hypothetical protein